MKLCRMLGVGSVFAAICGFLSAPSMAQVDPVLALSFGESAIDLEGATPSSEIVWFSIASESSDYASTTVPRFSVSAADVGGNANFEMPNGVPPHSIWVAVDMTTGVYALATPGDYPLRTASLASDALKVGKSDKVDQLAIPRSDLHVLLVRSSVGAWVGRFSEGAPDDADGVADGVLTAELAGFRALGDSPVAPDAYANGDLIIAIDPINMEVMVLRVRQ